MKRIAALALLTLSLAACNSDRRAPGSELFDEVDLKPVATVKITDDGFDPGELTITAGDAFTVKNTGTEAHSFMIEEPLVDTGDLEPGESTLIRLDTAGDRIATDRRNEHAELEITVKPAPDSD
jgi:plastocyanin